MSHSYIADCSNSGGKGDDTLIIIVNSDGTLSVDPETLQKLLANQHQNSPISLVRLDTKTEGSLDGGDDDGECDDDDIDSRVNLTVEGYYPPTPAPSSPTPPPTPVSETNMSTDGGGSDVLADSITEILQPEDVEKLETVLQSAHAKEILGDVVLDMLQKNGEEASMEDSVMTQHGSVVLDHCYASLSGPAPPAAVATPVDKPLSPQPTRGLGRGRGSRGGRGRGSMVQTKLALLPSATMVPVVEQLVMPGSPGTVTVRMPSSVSAKGQATVALQRVDLQQVLPSNVTPCKVLLNKVPVQARPTTSPPLPSGGGDNAAEWKSPEIEVVVPTKKKVGGRGRGRGVTTRGGRGSAGTPRGRGRGRGAPKLSEEEEAQNKRLAEEMAATVRALTLAEADQLAQIESMDQSGDTDRVIPLVNKVPAKKPVKVFRRHVEVGPKTVKVLKPEKPKVPPKSAPSESPSHEEKIAPEPKKVEKVIVVSMEPQITPAIVSAVVMSEGHSQQLTVTPATTSVPVPAPSTSSTPSHRKNYPKRENRKPPAHLAEAFGPALFSTPDIIRRVSTDKPPFTPTTPAPVMSTPLATTTLPQTSPLAAVTEPATLPANVPVSTELEADMGLTGTMEKDQDLLMATISSQVTKQEEQLLAEALLLEDLPVDAVLQDEVRSPSPSSQTIQPAISTTAVNQQQKPKKQTSLSSFFPVVNQTKDESKSDTVVENVTSVVSEITASPGVRILPPVELPATRGATKRASLQKEPAQDISVKKQQDTMKKVATSIEKRKSTDSKKSTESRKSSGSFREDLEDALVSDEASDEEGSYNSEDDPNRLWCICKRPHNNRFMICCDLCEDWFHGKCVGITKAMGEQMEENETEWLCPNCKKKKKQEETGKKPTGGGNNPSKKTGTQAPVVSPTSVKEKKEASKVMVQHQKLVVLGQDVQKTHKSSEIRITKVAPRKSTDEVKRADKEDTAEVNSTSAVHTSNLSGEDCIVCKKVALAGGVYCSDECIAKHTSESLAMIDKNAVIVFEKKTGRIYGGANAPTPATLTSWLMAHPSYQVMRPGVLPSAKFYNQTRPQPQSLLKQTVLQTRPQGIQLIAALPQPPPIEGPLKKNLLKAEASSSLKAKPQVVKGQQQITSLLKVQPKPTESGAETKAPVGKNLVTPLPPTTSKKPIKELKKTPQQPVVKKTTPTAVKKPAKEEAKQDQKKEEVRGKEAEEQTVRGSVRKTLQEVLTARLKETSDLKLSEEQIKKTAVQIEEELFTLFKDTSAKYKAKYRSLMFNIKDKNNLTLFRKIADKSLSPVQLVRLSPEELASQQLAQWREREARHQLEMIKKTELDAMQQAKTVVMKTHKGEQVVENELGIDTKVLETSVEIEPVMNPSTPIVLNIDKSSSKIKEHKHVVKENKEENQKERRHSHNKDHSRSRSRHRSRHRSDEHNRSKSKSRRESCSESADEANKTKENTATKTEEKSKPERSRSRHRNEDRSKSKSPSDRGRSKSRPRESSKSRSRDRSKSRMRERSKSQIRERSSSITRERSESMDGERSKSRPRERSKSRGRERSKSRPRERSKSRNRERSKSRPRERSKSRGRERSKSRPRERSKSRGRERSKSRPRERSKSSGRERSKSRSREISMSQSGKTSPVLEEAESKFIDDQISLENIHKNIELTIPRTAIFDAEIKDIIQDVVIQEEIGGRDEDLSDREPSSTVNISTPPFDSFEEEEEQEDVQKPPVWKGTLLMPDVAKFSTSIQEVSGVCGDLASDLPETIDCVGRISPETAWDYIAKMKKSGTKQILVIRFSSDNEEDKMSYLSFYSYLSSRNRLGVVGNNSKMIKDFYILPLPSHSPVPQVLLPLDGPGFEDYRPHLLLGIIVRTRRKRLPTDNGIPFVPKIAKKSERSYTPPLPDEDSHTPTQPPHPATESFTPPHSPKPPRIIKLKPRTSNKASVSPTVSDDFVLEDGDTPYTPEDADAPYSPGEEGSSSPGCSEELQRKVDQLNRMINDIEQKKQKIDSLSSIADMSPQQEVIIGTQDEEEELEEAYSPSGSISPPPTDTSFLNRKSANISLPSDLQDIIASLKKKPEEPKSIDLKSDPIVQAYRSADEPYSPEEEKVESRIASEERPVSPTSVESVSTQLSAKSLTTAIKVNRDPRQRPAQLSLSQLSDEEIMKKASEMGFMNPENPEPIPDKFKSRSGADSQSSTEEIYDPFAVEEDRSQNLAPLQPPEMPPFINQPFTSNSGHPTFTPDFPPPPRPPSFAPAAQFQPPHTYQAPPPPLPPSHIPFTNPQPPPPQPAYPPPPSQPAPLPPPPPRESTEIIASKKKFSKKSKKKSRDPRSRKEKKEKRKYSESPPPKDYDYDDSKFDKSRERDRYSFKKREKRETWRKEPYDKSSFPEKRRDSWEYEVPPPVLPPLPMMPGPPPHTFNMPPGPPMRGGPMRGGRFPRGMRGGFRRGFERAPMRGGFVRGGFHQRGHHMGGIGPPLPGPSRNFTPKSIHNEFEEDIRRFEEQRLKQKNLERKRWRKDSPPPPRKRRGKDDDSD